MRKQILSLCLLAVTAPSLWAAGEIFCCSEPGTAKRICGDSLPSVCRNQAYKMFDRGGNLIREISAPLTPEQKAAAAEEARRKKEVEDAKREQRRFDQALIDTYPTAADIDRAQQKAEAEINTSLAEAQTQLAELQKKHRRLTNEAEFYKRKTMPPELDHELRTVTHEIKLQQTVIDSKRKEMQVTRAKYDADRRRYAELTAQAASRQR